MPEFRPALQLSNLSGRDGFQISGEAFFNLSGTAVASAGDVNGDGFADVIIGAPNSSVNGYAGAAYVVFGKAEGFVPELDLGDLNGTNGFQINGEPGRRFTGVTVASAGDINGDGFADLLIGGYEQQHAYDGAFYVVFGKGQGFAPNLELSSLGSGQGFKLIANEIGNGETSNRPSAASAGDVNGDGFDDVIIGTFRTPTNGPYSGASYVVFGKAGGFAANLHLSSLNGTDGFRISGEAAGDYSGRSVASAGDINRDGFDDLIIGATLADHGGVSTSGAAYVIYGKQGSFGSNLQLSSLDGSNGFQINGEATGDQIGLSVAPAGDVNGDGFADVVIGAPYAAANDSHAGASYVVFGKAGKFAANFGLSTLSGANGFEIDGTTGGDVSGGSVAPAGDVNGDGFADVIIGAKGANSNGQFSGASYVVFGKARGFAADLKLSSLDGGNGFRIKGEAMLDYSGATVAAAGDVNGDGFADVVVGAPLADPNGSASGASYVVFGHRALAAVERTGTARGNTINGGRGDDTIRGLDGNDRLIAWEGNDLVAGGNGRDRLIGRGGNDRLIGGASADVLIGGLGNDIFDFNAVTDSGTTEGTRDVIRDFTHLADKIDLSDLGTLVFIGTTAFTGTGQVRVVQQGPNTIVEINLSGDAAPEMTIALLDVAAASLTAQDFIL